MKLISKIENILLFPESLKLTVNDALFFETIIEPLKKAGFIIENKENYTYEIKGIPASLESVNIIELLHDLIEKSKTTEEDPSLHIKETIALTLSKAASLKVGQALTAEEMSALIDQLFACKDPYYTPDGKKIMIIISEEEIEKRFQK
jgi:DNA mismatch repair protein MutL